MKERHYLLGLRLQRSTFANRGNGSHALGQRADVSPPTSAMYEIIRTAEMIKLVWDHTFETLNRIEMENAKKDVKPGTYFSPCSSRCSVIIRKSCSLGLKYSCHQHYAFIKSKSLFWQG